jgi:hypothetical protein
MNIIIKEGVEEEENYYIYPTGIIVFAENIDKDYLMVDNIATIIINIISNENGTFSKAQESSLHVLIEILKEKYKTIEVIDIIDPKIYNKKISNWILAIKSKFEV